VSASLLISFLATLYPSYRASRIQPAEALRYE
jgi:lipoprotein-releasing system permease protein